MPFVTQILRDEYRLLLQYEKIDRRCGEADAIYFPRDVVAQIQADMFFSDLVSSGLEQLMELNFSPINERFIEAIRCRMYARISFALTAGLETANVAGRSVTMCPSQCVQTETIIGRRRNTTSPNSDGSCPTGFRTEQ